MSNIVWNYSARVFLIIGGVFAIALLAAALESEDVDDLCSTNNSILKRINGTWTCTEDSVDFNFSCSNNEILKYSSTNNNWTCATDATGGGAGTDHAHDQTLNTTSNVKFNRIELTHGGYILTQEGGGIIFQLG